MTELKPLTCQDIVELVTEYLEGGLEPPDRLSFERHVAICPPCRGYLTQIRRVMQTAGRLEVDALPERVRNDLLDAFRAWKEARSP